MEPEQSSSSLSSSLVERKQLHSSSEGDTSSNKNVCESDFVLQVAADQYLNKDTVDVHILCEKDGVRIPAHKTFLCASKVFHKEFYGKNTGVKAFSGEISLPHSSKTIQDFLQFFYKNKFELDLENITDVMSLVHTYGMTECLEVCGNFWSKHLTIDDVCDAYQWAIPFKINGLTKFLNEMVSINSEQVFDTVGFLTCPNYVLEHILSLDYLMCRESVVFGACLAWARNACERDSLDSNQIENLRKYLIISERKDGSTVERNLLYKIHYKSMTINEFLNQIGKYAELFTSTDWADIMRLIAGSSDVIGSHFKTEPRSSNIFIWNDDKNVQIISYSHQASARLNMSANTIIISTNRPVLLGGIYCSMFSSSNRCYENNASVTITEEKINNPNNISEVIFSKSMLSLSSTSDTFLDFRQTPIVIRSHHDYRIQMTIPNAPSFYLCVLNSEIKLNDDTFIRLSTANGENRQTIIKRFCFNLL